MNLLDLPNIMLIEILEYLSYDEVSKKRLVCRRVDDLCQQVLNGGFNKVIKQHSISFKRIKALLPRRESERRNHCLARHADILTSIETRISMLTMTYTKYMDLNLCCFIPGRVLDEIFRILRLIAKTTKQLRPHEVLQELRDISSMAIEHFDEKIANTLKKSFADNNKLSSSSNSSCSSSSSNSNCGVLGTSGLASISFSGLGPGGGITSSTTSTSRLYCTSSGIIKDRLLTRTTPSYETHHLHHATDSGTAGGWVAGCSDAKMTMLYFKKLESEYKKSILKMHRTQLLQSKRLHQALSSVAQLNTQIVELKKRLEDVDAKNREISANIKHINIGNGGAATGASPDNTPSKSQTQIAASPQTPLIKSLAACTDNVSYDNLAATSSNSLANDKNTGNNKKRSFEDITANSAIEVEMAAKNLNVNKKPKM